jgi:hypothetical protein
MTTFTTASAVVLAGLMAAGAASAQSDSNSGTSSGSGSGSGSDQQQMAGGSDRSAKDLTCAEITAMDTAQVPAVLYYVAGYDQRANENGGDSGGSAGETSASAGSDGSGSGSSGSGDQQNNMMAGDSGSGGGQSAGSDSSDTGSGGGASSGSDGNQPQIVRVTGFYEIPVERTMVACGQAPKNRVSDVMREQSGQSGSGSAGSSGG